MHGSQQGRCERGRSTPASWLTDAVPYPGVPQFREALAMLTEVVELCPSFTLGYYKVALVLLALGGPSAIAQARHPFRCAARLEPDNSILRGNIDLTLRVIMYD